jgi:dephospho-CoA kinase
LLSKFRMLAIGLTGGICTGKTAVSEWLEGAGCKVCDTDDLARHFTQPGQPVLAQIAEAFGPALFDPDGTLNRGALAERVFNDLGEREKLEHILHPAIREAWQRQLAEWRTENVGAACVVIPLLYETGAESSFDAVLCTACSAATQRSRLRKRGWSDAQIDARLAAQLPQAAKLERADFVIWTEGAMASTEGQLREVLRCLDGVAAQSR